MPAYTFHLMPYLIMIGIGLIVFAISILIFKSNKKFNDLAVLSTMLIFILSQDSILLGSFQLLQSLMVNSIFPVLISLVMLYFVVKFDLKIATSF